MKKKNTNYLVWLDLEMSGINPNYHKILELATLITDENFNIIANGPIIPIYQSNKIISLMDYWNIKIHTFTGLLKKVKNSNFNEKKAEYKTLKFIKKWIYPKSSPICGNNIYHDRKFLFKFMPNLDNYFHFTSIDVSMFRLIIKKYYSFNFFKDKNKHSAYKDIILSIKELIFLLKISKIKYLHLNK